MMKNKEDQWLHQMMQEHRKGLDMDIKQRDDDFTSKVMSQLPRKESRIVEFLETKLFWNGLLCLCLAILIGVTWMNGNLSALFTHDAWLSSVSFRMKQILNILLQFNPRNTLSIDKGILLLTSIPWLKSIVLISVLLAVALFEWKNPWCMRKDKNCF